MISLSRKGLTATVTLVLLFALGLGWYWYGQQNTVQESTLEVTGEYVPGGYYMPGAEARFLKITNLSNESIVVNQVIDTSSTWIGNIVVLDTEYVSDCEPVNGLTECATDYEIAAGESAIFGPSKEGGFVDATVKVQFEGKKSQIKQTLVVGQEEMPTPAEEAKIVPPPAPTSSVSSRPPNPLANLKVGDVWGDFTVISVQASSQRDSYYIDFSGTTTVRGTYNDEIGVISGPCFNVADEDKYKIRLPQEDQSPWFCFTNVEEVRRALSSTTGSIHVRISDYQRRSAHKEVSDSATFVELVSVDKEEAYIIYTVHPGFVTPEAFAEFEKTKKTCVGRSEPIPSDPRIADGPSTAKCFGYLK